tara:strand:+ start:164 stop:463 length:300 start_codon:yes stop_codon:yes gene_type:complete
MGMISVNGVRREETSEEKKSRESSQKIFADERKNADIEELRFERNMLLRQSDWVVIKEREEGGTVKNFADWKEYRQKLRDITNTYKSLEEVKWPTAPSE